MGLLSVKVSLLNILGKGWKLQNRCPIGTSQVTVFCDCAICVNFRKGGLNGTEMATFMAYNTNWTLTATLLSHCCPGLLQFRKLPFAGTAKFTVLLQGI